MNERTWTFASPTKTELDIYMTSFTWVKKQLTSVVYKVSVSCSDDESEAHIVVPLKFSFICLQFLNQFRGDSKLVDAAFFYPSTMPLLKLGGKKISCENKIIQAERLSSVSFYVAARPISNSKIYCVPKINLQWTISIFKRFFWNLYSLMECPIRLVQLSKKIYSSTMCDINFSYFK